jgi:hypothetical protein
VDRVVIVVPLRPGASAEAEKLIESGPPLDPEEMGFESHGVYVTSDEVIFIFEGAHAKDAVEELTEDPRLAAALSRWRGLVDVPPRVAREKYVWAQSAG